MARISTYVTDNNIVPEDKVLGTDADGFRTKNYTFEGIVDWLNRSGSIVINGQNSYFFQTEPAPTGRLQGTLSFAAFGGNGTLFSDIYTIKISEESLLKYGIPNYLESLLNENILIAQLDNTDNFGVFNINSIIPDILEPGFYDLGLTYIKGNNYLLQERFYGLSVYAGASPPGDKAYVYTQAVPSTIWNITHNLNKLPSVTVVNINNVTVYGEVIYVDLNNLRIEFSAGFSGKAYMN